MKLTIATPTYGRAKYLNDCIDSVNAQSLPTSHNVCIGGKIDNLYKTDFCLIKNIEPDPGMVPCWNEAANLATTEYIGFLADDNLVEQNFAKEMTDFLDTHPDCDLVFCNQGIIDANSVYDEESTKNFTSTFGRDIFSSGIIDKKYYPRLIQYNSIPIEASVIRKSVWDKYGPFDNTAKGAFDMYFTYNLLLDGLKIGFISKPLMRFRLHSESYTARVRKEHLQGSIWVYETLLKKYPEERALLLDTLTAYRGRLLRYKISISQRAKIMKMLFFTKGGIFVIFKNTVAGIFKRKK